METQKLMRYTSSVAHVGIYEYWNYPPYYPPLEVVIESWDYPPPTRPCYLLTPTVTENWDYPPYTDETEIVFEGWNV